MTAHEFDKQFAKVVKTERKISRTVVSMIMEAEDKKYYAELGFPSSYIWLTQGHGYSNGAACRRRDAARVLRAVPQTGEKLENGEVNLSTLCQAQSAMKAHTKATGERLTSEQKAEIVEEISNKTCKEVQDTLFERFPETASNVHQERETALSEKLTRLSFNFSNDAMADLEWVRNFYSHSIPDGELALVFAKLLKDLRKHEEAKGDRAVARFERAQREAAAKARSAAPTGAGTGAGAENGASSESEMDRVKESKAGARRVSLHRVQRACEYVDPVSGRVCGSQFMAESDHIIPRALGGEDRLRNYRCLCRVHNQLVAEQKLGEVYRAQFEKRRARAR